MLYLQMPISAHMKKTHWKWGHCDSLIGWLRHVFQMDHGVSIFAPANKYPDAKASIVHYTMAIYDFWHLVSRNFGWWSNALFLLGNVRCYFNRKTKMLWLLMIINILIFAKFLHTRNGVFKNHYFFIIFSHWSAIFLNETTWSLMKMTKHVDDAVSKRSFEIMIRMNF